jgi:hypothetical protein
VVDDGRYLAGTVPLPPTPRIIKDLRLVVPRMSRVACYNEQGIVTEAKKRRPRRQKVVPADKLGVRLIKMLRRNQERWPGELSDLARHLREFADALDMRSRKKTRG